LEKRRSELEKSVFRIKKAPVTTGCTIFCRLFMCAWLLSGMNVFVSLAHEDPEHVAHGRYVSVELFL